MENPTADAYRAQLQNLYAQRGEITYQIEELQEQLTEINRRIQRADAAMATAHNQDEWLREREQQALERGREEGREQERHAQEKSQDGDEGEGESPDT